MLKHHHSLLTLEPVTHCCTPYVTLPIVIRPHILNSHACTHGRARHKLYAMLHSLPCPLLVSLYPVASTPFSHISKALAPPATSFRIHQQIDSTMMQRVQGCGRRLLGTPKRRASSISFPTRKNTNPPPKPDFSTCTPTLERCRTCPKFPCNRRMSKRLYDDSAWYRKVFHPFPVLAFFGIGYALVNTERVPISSRLRLHLMPEFVRNDLDQSLNDEMIQSLTPRSLPPSSEMHQRVKRLGDRICKANGLPQLQYFIVNDDSEQNAYVSSGGIVLVYTGLLKLISDDDELAMVIAHEMGHYVAQHGAERTVVDWIKQGVNRVFDFDKYESARKLTTLCLTLPNSRIVESEADLIGLIMVARACFDLTRAAQVWTTLHDDKLRRQAEEQAAFEAAQLERDEYNAAHDEMDPGMEAVTSSFGVGALLEDSMEPTTLTERLWTTHPSHAMRIHNFRADGPWMKRARDEQLRCCCVRGNQISAGSVEELKPVPWWYKYTKQVSTPSESTEA
eukprot:m.172256 g.172256  ORF g.172256 m.172256 type:complete len:507 (-) comp14575_c0_seq1:516-2036(-)